jgi:hypothetical protein
MARGRPKGVKNKPKQLLAPPKIAHQARILLKSIQEPIPVKRENFSEAVAKMIASDNKVDWKSLAKKLETELRIVRGENDDLAKICIERWEKIQDKEKIIKYLEGRIEDITIRGC